MWVIFIQTTTITICIIYSPHFLLLCLYHYIGSGFLTDSEVIIFKFDGGYILVVIFKAITFDVNTNISEFRIFIIFVFLSVFTLGSHVFNCLTILSVPS